MYIYSKMYYKYSCKNCNVEHPSCLIYDKDSLKWERGKKHTLLQLNEIKQNKTKKIRPLTAKSNRFSSQHYFIFPPI